MTLTTELNRLTPAAVDADYDALARRGRRRRAAGRAARRGGVLAVVVALAAGAVTALPALRGGAPSRVEFADDGPGEATGEVTGEAAGEVTPVGQWRQVSDPPFGPRLVGFSGVLSDGRVLVSGGQEGLSGAGGLRDGAVWDPAADAWEPIPASPLDPGAFRTVALAGDRLLVYGSNGGARDGAVWDAATGEWTVIAGAPPGVAAPRVAGWDGERLVVIGPQRPGEEALGDPSHLASWTAAGGWLALEPSPLASDLVTTALSGDLLAVVSYGPGGGYGHDPATGGYVPLEGSTAERSPAPPEGGAILNLATGRWTRLPAGAIPATPLFAVAWIDAGLALVGALSGDPSPPVVVDPATLAVTPLARPPLNLSYSVARAPDLFAADRALLTVSGPVDGAPAVTALLPDGTWTLPVRGGAVLAGAGRVIATTAEEANPGYEAALRAWEWTGTTWRTLTPAPAPVRNRSSAAVVVTDGGLLVAGGWSVRAAQSGEEPDGVPSEGEVPGPYMTDVHADAWLLDLPDR